MFPRKRLAAKKLKKIRDQQIRASKRKPFLEQLEQRLVMNSDWQNSAYPSDVNNDMVHSPIDALIVINKLNRVGQGRFNLGPRTNSLDYYPDVSGDSSLTPIDALLVINSLNQRQGRSNVAERLDGEAFNAPVGFISMPMIGLPGDRAQLVDVAMQLSIDRKEFNELGMFVVDGPNGAVNGVLPTAPNYPAVVFESSQRQVIYSRLDLPKVSQSVTFPGGSYLAVYILQSPSANGDAASHIRVKPNSSNQLAIGWEEHVAINPTWPTVGDRSYDDATVAVQISAPYDGNTAPVIRNIPTQSIDELNTLSVQTFVVDADLPNDKLTYSIQSGPSGVSIDRDTGLFTWTPTEVQGPGVFPVTLKVTDASGASDTELFTITVRETNEAPVLGNLVDQKVEPGALLSFTATATDPDFPSNALRFSLAANAPAGASIDPITGQFQWTPTDSQVAQVHSITVRVSDNGVPIRTAEKTISVTVGDCPFAAGFTGIANSESGGSSQGKGSVVLKSCVATLTEGDSFTVLLQGDFTVPAESSYLEFNRSNLLFDRSDRFINDAFEAALLDEAGNSLVHKVEGSRDAFYNITEGQADRLGANTRLVGELVRVDLAHIAPGTKARLVLRLVNNDSDTTTSVGVSKIAIVKGSLGTPGSIVSGAQVSRQQAAIDFTSLADVTASMSTEYASTSFEQDGDLLQTNLRIRNQGRYSLNSSLLVVIDRISDPSVRVFRPDGTTPTGQPYFDFSDDDPTEQFDFNEVTAYRQLLFNNPNAIQFSYDVIVLGQINRPPLIQSEAITEAVVGRPYSYTIDAFDPDQDSLAYSILTGPNNVFAGRSIQWTPKPADIGTHTVKLRVSDGRGGAADQSFTITVTDPPPNRPPVFTSTPVVEANIGQPYLYDSNATDADSDTLTYRLVDGQPGMSVDSATGKISWTPPVTTTKTWDAAQDFSTQQNAGSTWSYGTMSSQGGVLHLYPRHTNVNGLDVWDDPGIASASLPTVIYNGGSTAFSEPPNGSALQFDGLNDFVQANDAPSLRPTSVTLEGWANFASLPSIEVLFGKTIGGSFLDSYQIWYQDGQLKGAISDSSQMFVVATPWTPTLGRWYHVAFTFDDITNTETLYIDGVQVAVGTTTASIAYDSHPFEIGKDTEHGSPAFHFKGSLDEVRLWSVARTASEIRNEMFRTLTGNEAGLAAYYPLNSNATSSVPDASPNHNDGTLSPNGPTYVDSSVPFPFQQAGMGDGLTWQPGQLSVHPGGENQRSVIRWTAPVAGNAKINAMFSSLDGIQAATTDVHVLFNGKSLFEGNIVGRGSTSTMPPSTVEVTVGDTIDFLVGFGNGSASFDTTLVDANISMDVASASVPVSIAADDGRGGTATQSFTIAILPKSGNHDPAFVSTPITSMPRIRPAYSSRLLETLDSGSKITGLAVSGDGKLYIGNNTGPIYQHDLANNTLSVLKTTGLLSSGRMIVSDGGPWGTDLIHADSDYSSSNNFQGVVYRTNRQTGDSQVVQFGTFGRSFGDPFGVAIGQGGAFGDDLYIMDFQGASSQGPVLNRVTSTGQVVAFAEGGPWTLDSLPTHIEISPGGLFGDYIYVADSASKKIWRVSPNGQITQFITSEPVTPVSLRFSPSGGFGEDLYALEASGRILRIESDGKVTPLALQITNLDPNQSIVSEMVFSQDGSRLYLGIGNRVYEITANTRYAYTAIAMDADNDNLTYSMVEGPDGMTIDPATGLITWNGQDRRVDREGPAPSNGLTLTPAAQAAGYKLTEFVRGIPMLSGIGPLGMAFTSDGGVLVSDYSGNVRKFPDDSDGQDASAIVPSQNYGGDRAIDMTQIGDRIFMSKGSDGSVVEINQDGTFKQLIASGLGRVLGIDVNPSNGHLLVASTSNVVYDIDPVAKTAKVLFNAFLDGISVSPDGLILYGATISSSTIVGFSLAAASLGSIVFDSGPIQGGVDGAALGFGDSAGYIFANTNQGTVVAIDLRTKQQTLIASGGTRGDFAKVDPRDGTLLLTQSSTIARLQLPAGSSFRTNFKVGIRVEDGQGGSDVQNFVLQLTDGTAEIRGQVRQDPSTQANPLGLSGFLVYLDQNQNGLLDSEERYTTTDSSGNYTFGGLKADTYIVAQGVHSGWRQTSPANGTYSIDLANGQSVAGFDFINIPSTVAEIRGTKFHDLNDDGVRNQRNSTVHVRVPGTSDTWLAGMPDGSTASSGDFAPAQSPVQVVGLNFVSGSSVSFQVTGSVSFVSSPSGDSPDGAQNSFFTHSDGAQNGISSLRAPVNSLIAVFLGPDQPNLTPAPAMLDFSANGNVPGGIEYSTLSPKLKQPFFVGDGRTSNGKSQQIIVPQGATRMFLGSMDSYGWYDNSGAFEVDVTGLQPEPGLKNWTIYLDQNSNGLRDPGEPSTLTDADGQYAFTNLVPGSYVVAEELFPTYDAVRDFSANQNPNSPWTYGMTETRGAAFQQLQKLVVSPQLAIWKGTDRGPDLIGNLTGNTIPGGITYPPDALSLDPSFDGRNSVLRFTAPVTDTYHVTGRFQGIDLTRGPTTDVAILQNSNSILAGNINGFFRDLATTPGAILPFDLQVSLKQGDTLDFSVGRGPDDSLFDSTGVSAFIVGANWRQTSPATKTHQITVVAGEVHKLADFGNLELAAQPVANHPPRITSSAITESGVGARYRLQAKATDEDRDNLTFDLPVKPEGMIIDAVTGLIAWTPVADQAGVQNVILRVRDGKGGVDLQSFQIVVESRNSGPVITSRPPGPAQINLPYQYRIRAQDAEGDAITFALSSRAIGNMKVDPATGVFSWLPQAGDIGSHTIEVTATDDSGDGQLQKFTLEVVASAPNRVPEVLSTPRDQVRLGNSYLYALDAIDPDGDPLTYRLDVAPNGMTIDANGMIAWTPSSAQFGDNSVQVSVSDGRGGVRSQTFSISVLSQAENHAPIISSTATLVATLGVAYRYAVKATDADGDTLAFSLDTKPNGMSIDALSGAIRWTPTADQLGAHSIVLRVTDPQGSNATQSFTVTVRGSNLPPEISSAPRTTAAVGGAYTYRVKASDPEGGPLTYTLARKSGNMIIDSTGVIQWVPGASEAGNVQVVVRVSDEQGGSVEQAFTVVVAAVGPNLPPVITSQPILGATVGQLYQYQVTAVDPDGGPVRFAFLEVPNGMTIDESTGLIRWTSDAAGIGRVTVLVGDFDGGDAEQSFEVVVRSSNEAPQITSTPVLNTAAGITYRYDVRANDPNLDPLSYALVTGPSGMAIDDLGRITWTTSTADAGTHRVKVSVSDDRGATAVQEYSLVVAADTEAPKIRIQVDSNPVGLNETLTIQVNATDNIGVKTLDVTVDGKTVALDSRGRASVLMSRTGSVRIAAVASDAAGNTGRQNLDVLVIDTSVTDAPTVDVTIPAENATITAPTDVIGTVQDPNLVSWKLEVAPVDGGDFKQIATGTNQVTNGKIATFDPTLLQNDSYILRLTAVNTGGLSSSIDTVVNVTGNLKLGNFTLSFTDLTIQVGGIPITVSRTYDTLNANQDGELGFGWQISFREVDLRTNLTKTGDEAGGLFTPYRDGTKVYITLPGGKREGFTFRPKAINLFDPYQRERDVPPEYQPGNGLNSAYFVPSFVPDKGVTSKLTVPRYQLSKNGHEYYQFGGGLPYNPEDTSFGGRFQLVTKDDVIFSIDAGLKQLTRATSATGNSLVFSGSEITSSSGGRISFERDARGRIVSVEDMNDGKIKYSYNSAGDLIVVSDRQNNQTKFQYSTERPHYLERVVDPLNRTGIRTEFDTEGRLLRVFNGSGKSSTITYDPSRSTQTITNARGFATSFVYDLQGNVISETNPLGHTTTRTFDGDGNILSETDPLGHKVSYTFDQSGNLLTQTDALGNTIHKTYVTIDVPGFGNTVLPESETDPLGNAIRYMYDSKGQLLSSSDSSGKTVEFTYDSNGRIVSSGDTPNRSVFLGYDKNGNLASTTDARGQITNYVYSRNGFPIAQSVTRVGSNGTPVTLTTTGSLDANDRITKFSGANGQDISLDYDAAGNQTQFKNTSGSTLLFSTDSAGQRSGLTFADGTSVNASRDEIGNITRYTDRRGQIISSEYDALDRLIKTTYPDGSVEILEYDAADRLIARIDGRGNRTTYTYDAMNRLISTADPLGNTFSTIYDANGEIIAETDANGNTTRYEQTTNGTRVIFADGSSTSQFFDIATNSTTQTDEAGNTTKFLFDDLGSLIGVIDAAGNRVGYTYNQLGQMTSQIDANQRVTRWEYSDLGSLQKTTLPMGMSESGTYDSQGRLASVVNFNGDTVSYSYDSQNRVTQVIANGKILQAASYTSTGKFATSTDSLGTTQYSYDTRDRLIKVEQADGQKVEYEYDAAGNRTSIKTSAGKTTYTYDQGNRLIRVIDSSGAVTSYEYDRVGNLTATFFPTGVKETRGYDNRNRLLSIQQTKLDKVVQSYVYTIDLVGRRSSVTESNGRKVLYVYDTLGRLLRESIIDPQTGNSSIEYSYDKVGNRLTMNNSNGVLTNYSYDANDRLLAVTSGSSVTQYMYDNNGNLLSRRTDTSDSMQATWNALDQMTSVQVLNASGLHSYSYEYNFAGLRVSEKIDGRETRFLWDEQLPYGQILSEYGTDGTLLSSYVFGLTRISRDSDGVREYYLTDGLGSNRILTDASGQVIQRYVYDAFGSTLSRTGASSNRFQFAGEQLDEGLETYYLRARAYGPALGRFLSTDAASPNYEQTQSIDRYVYGLNDPTNRVDPSGLESVVNQLGAVAMRTLVSVIRNPVTYQIGGALGGLYTLRAITQRNWNPFNANAMVLGASASLDSRFRSRSLGVSIDALVEVKNQRIPEKNHLPFVLTVGPSAAISVRPEPKIRFNANNFKRFYTSTEFHVGLAWKQDFPPKGGDLQTSLTFASAFTRGGFKVAVQGTQGVTLSVGFPANEKASYGFQYVAGLRVDLVEMRKLISTFQRRIFTRPSIGSLPNGVSFQFAVQIYLGDLSDFLKEHDVI